MRKILIFARELIPYCNSVGSSIRVVTMANYLVRCGFQVKLLAAKGTEVSYFGMENEVRSLNPTYLDDSLQSFYTEKAKKLRDAPRLVQASSLLQRAKVWLKAIVKAAALPDIAIFYLPKFIRKALIIIREEKIEILLVSSPPHSSQVLGLVVKYVLGRNIFLVVDYRDGWNSFSLFRSQNLLKRWFDIKIEKQVLLNSDLFIYQSSTVLRQINEEFFPNNDRVSEKSLLVRNGYTTLEKNMPVNKSSLGSQPKDTHYVLGYFGGIDFERQGYRNPIQLLRLLDKCNYKCEFQIYGNASGMAALEAFQNVKVIYKGQVPLNDAKEAMRSCDGLLVFHAVMRGGEEVIPGKFYEYIDACRPILVYGPAGMECGLMVKQMRIGSFISVDERPQDIEQLKEFIEGYQLDIHIKNLEINRAEFSRDVQYEKLIAALNRTY
jgi:glycosyltransferase involved in cell wall biosynthesis